MAPPSSTSFPSLRICVLQLPALLRRGATPPAGADAAAVSAWIFEKKMLQMQRIAEAICRTLELLDRRSASETASAFVYTFKDRLLLPAPVHNCAPVPNAAVIYSSADKDPAALEAPAVVKASAAAAKPCATGEAPAAVHSAATAAVSSSTPQQCVGFSYPPTNSAHDDNSNRFAAACSSRVRSCLERLPTASPAATMPFDLLVLPEMWSSPYHSSCFSKYSEELPACVDIHSHTVLPSRSPTQPPPPVGAAAAGAAAAEAAVAAHPAAAQPPAAEAAGAVREAAAAAVREAAAAVVRESAGEEVGGRERSEKTARAGPAGARVGTTAEPAAARARAEGGLKHQQDDVSICRGCFSSEGKEKEEEDGAGEKSSALSQFIAAEGDICRRRKSVHLISKVEADNAGAEKDTATVDTCREGLSCSSFTFSPAFSFMEGLAQRLRVYIIGGSLVEREMLQQQETAAAQDGGDGEGEEEEEEAKRRKENTADRVNSIIKTSEEDKEERREGREGKKEEKEIGKIYHLYNTCCVFDSGGRFIHKYRKAHLFDVNILKEEDPSGKGIVFQESSVLSAGNTLGSFTLPSFGNIGVGICYDLRFPEYALALAQQRHCHLLCYPGAFNEITGPPHWALLLRGRALDNQLYVVGCSPASPSITAGGETASMTGTTDKETVTRKTSAMAEPRDENTREGAGEEKEGRETNGKSTATKYTLNRATAGSNNTSHTSPQTSNLAGEYPCYGHSMVVGPWGDVIAQLEGEPGVIVTTAAVKPIHLIRKQIPLYRQKRFNEIYSNVTEIMASKTTSLDHPTPPQKATPAGST